MNRNLSGGSPEATPAVRCAVYTRKATSADSKQAFNSLGEQRKAAETYITDRKHEGWICLSERYDDGGFSGVSMNRPALRRLLENVQTGKVDCIVVHNIDRLSRSVADFARILEMLDRHGTLFVSVSQPFNTETSAGRTTLKRSISFLIDLFKKGCKK